MNISCYQRSNLWYQKLGNLLDSDGETNKLIELELLFGVVEPLEKGDDSFPSFGDASLTCVFVWSIMEIYGLTKRIDNPYK